jgi:hypothetical protein
VRDEHIFVQRRVAKFLKTSRGGNQGSDVVTVTLSKERIGALPRLSFNPKSLKKHDDISIFQSDVCTQNLENANPVNRK